MTSFPILPALALPLTLALPIVIGGCSRETPEVFANNATASVGGPSAGSTATGPAGDGSTFGGMAKPKDPTTDYVGRWIGVEGMVLTVKHAATPGRYRLDMQWDLDHRGTFKGEAAGNTIVFERNGVRETLRPTQGEATGLKYLADRRECLTVKTGEGYCRK